MEEFDLLNSPLAGTNLIEASAGTGKTYAIAGLFVRLVVERALPVREILVVTYTVAATEELRDRIRARLRQGEDALRRGCSEDAFLSGLIGKFSAGMERENARQLLLRAIHDFDEAAIFTIHSFCQRVLHENAFESGTLFDAELLPDEAGIKGEIIRDFWRTHFYGAAPEFVGYALSRQASPGYYMDLLNTATTNPDTALVPEVPPPSPEELQAGIDAFRMRYACLKDAWRRDRENIIGRLQDPSLSASIYGRRVEVLAMVMDDYCRNEESGFPLCERFDQFTPAALDRATKAKCATPMHGFFLLCESLMAEAEALQSLMDRCLLYLKAEAVRMVRRELPLRKGRRNVLSYDDLLLRLRNALSGPGGEALAATVRGRYQAALIDEFQDTDPIQYAIFAALFPSPEGAQEGGESCLFLIGDPKQAIYSFRGADIFAYLQAAARVGRKYTLSENWRSDPGLIKAVNAVLLHARNPFIYRGIGFPPARAADKAEREYFTIDDRREAPLVAWFVEDGRKSSGDDGPGKPLPKTAALPIIAKATAAEIGRLIRLGRQGKARIGKKRLAAGDIAVLVRTNREARLIQDAIQSLRIPSVISSRESVLLTAEAGMVARLLTAISTPSEEAYLRAALTEDLLGVGGKELDGLLSDEVAWGGRLVRFQAYHDAWQKRGFIQMFRLLLAGEDIPGRLLAFPDGERRLTNVLHISELLHRASIRENLTMKGLLTWLMEQRSAGGAQPEEHELRLESDEYAVKIVTIHKSKGLEYPIVFCPFVWHGSQERKGASAIVYHDPERNFLPFCDLGSPELAVHREISEKECLAENVRLLYVALTRGRHRCYFIWGRFKGAESSAPAYLFHQGSGVDDNEESLWTAVRSRFLSLREGEVYAELEQIVRQAEGMSRLSSLPQAAAESFLPAEDGGTELTCREFTGRIDRSWRIASFTLLTSGLPASPEVPDRDALSDSHALEGGGSGDTVSPIEPSDRKMSSEGDGIFAFPKGAAAGTFFHDILEHLDFTETDKTVVKPLVTEKLTAHGFDPAWESAVTAVFEKVVRLPLMMPPVEGAPLTLSLIPDKGRLNELEFTFPLRPLTPRDLESVFQSFRAQSGSAAELSWGGDFPLALNFPERMGRLQFSPVRGFMKGFIDLVFYHEEKFYLVDWKSNHLGHSAADYHERALASVMGKALYFLQYHLYTVALHRYLTLRLPGYHYETHFGGVFYCFLRGMDPAWGPEYGVFRDRPFVGLVEALAERLIDM